MPKRAKDKAKKKSKVTVAVEWERLQSAEKLVAEVVADHHPHLARARIICLAKPKAGKRGESIVAATARKAPKNLAALYKDAAGVDVHYLIEIGRDRWDAATAEQKRILIDHELCHFTGLDDRGAWGLRPDHDIEEFHEIIKRHGDKLGELRGVLRAVRQMSMFEKGEEAE